MTTSASVRRSAEYRPALAWFAALGSVWVFVLVLLGAFTTSIGAGMAFPDWPLSNGSLNPEGWLTNVAMFAEHSHRLSGATMGLITLALAGWLWRVESRRWVVNLGWAAVAIVVVQGLIGGQRVTLDSWYLSQGGMSVGQMLRIPHGVLAQLFVVVLFAIAAAVSRPWVEAPSSSFRASDKARRLSTFATVLVIAQLVIAATMRHVHAGLAIPTFPLTPEGSLLPGHWDFAVGIHFAHRAMALVVGLALLRLAYLVERDPNRSPLLRTLAATMTTLLVCQIALGAAVIWSGRDPYTTTAHVIVGAFTLAVTFLLAFFLHRNALQPAPEGTGATERGNPGRTKNLARGPSLSALP